MLHSVKHCTSYNFDAATGALTVFDKVHDSNGCAGFLGGGPRSTDPNAELTAMLAFSADSKTLVATIPGLPALTLYRIPSR